MEPPTRQRLECLREKKKKKKVPLEQRLKGGEGVGQTVIWMKSVSARENSQCKGPKAGWPGTFQEHQGGQGG